MLAVACGPEVLLNKLDFASHHLPSIIKAISDRAPGLAVTYSLLKEGGCIEGSHRDRMPFARMCYSYLGRVGTEGPDKFLDAVKAIFLYYTEWCFRSHSPVEWSKYLPQADHMNGNAPSGDVGNDDTPSSPTGLPPLPSTVEEHSDSDSDSESADVITNDSDGVKMTTHVDVKEVRWTPQYVGKMPHFDDWDNYFDSVFVSMAKPVSLLIRRVNLDDQSEKVEIKYKLTSVLAVT